MDAKPANSPAAIKNGSTTERISDRELVVTRTFEGPAHLIFKAWVTPELLMRWWAPKSFGIKLVGCEVDARTGGSYRFTFDVGQPEPMAFFGKYLEVTPPSRLVWTNEESGDAGSVTTVTFEEKDGKTHLVLLDLYPSKDALNAALASESTGAYPEQFDQLDKVLRGED